MDNSLLKKLKNVKNADQVTELLKGENLAIVTAVLRSKKWASVFIPFYIEHHNPLIRFEIATSPFVELEVLKKYKMDQSVLVRQAAKNNLILRFQEN